MSTLYSNCPKCLRTVKLRPDNTFAYHVQGLGEGNDKCPGCYTSAKWAEARPLLAMARNTKGDCMRCGTPVTEGPKENCPQCGHNNWVREKHKTEPRVFEE